MSDRLLTVAEAADEIERLRAELEAYKVTNHEQWQLRMKAEAERSVINEIAAERRRQIKKGWTPEHDDEHADGSLALAAVAYATRNPTFWPWTADSWKPRDGRRNLIRAAALIVAEIERMDRADK